MNKIHVWINKKGEIKETSKTNETLVLYIGHYFTEGFNLLSKTEDYVNLITRAKFFSALWLETKVVVS